MCGENYVRIAQSSRWAPCHYASKLCAFCRRSATRSLPQPLRQRGQVEADGLYLCLCCHLCLRFDCDFDCEGLPQPLMWGSHVEADWPYSCLCRHLFLRFDHDRVACLKSHSANVEGYDAHYNHVDLFFATRSKRNSRRRGPNKQMIAEKAMAAGQSRDSDVTREP